MPLIKVSEPVKDELEKLKQERSFKSMDAVIRHFINSSLSINGGIFLGSMEDGASYPSDYISFGSIRRVSVANCFTHSYVSSPETIRLYKCLKCQTTSIQDENELILVPNCAGCGKGMTPITIQVGFPDS